MSIWEILGIPPTTDIVTIKKAYADRAKEWHPEEYPEEFKRLRNAYQTAVRWAKSSGAGQAGASVEPPPAKRAEPQQEVPRQEKTQQEKARQEAPQQEERAEEPPPQFSYDDVTFFYQKELAEHFFREFFWIAWNPYLQNRKAVWHYFLLRPDYDDLYCHEGFWQKLLQEICAISGWYVETLEYFEWWQNLYRETDLKGQEDDTRMNDANRKWRWKKRRSKYTGFISASREQSLEHYAILQTMKERGMDESLMNAASAAAYLKYYKAFMKDNEEWLECQRGISHRKRLKHWMFGILLLFLAIILILVLVIKSVLNTAKEEEAREQRKREEAILREEQESREQEEWRQELDERFENMQEQYRDWMEQ